MSSPKKSNTELEQQFIALFKSFTEYGATVNIQQDKENTGSDVVAIITPLNPQAAKIDARLELDFGVYLLFGVASAFEVPLKGGYYTKGSCMEEVKALCAAVIRGRFEEEIVTVNGQLLKGTTTLVLENGKVIRESWSRFKFYPFHHKDTSQYKYSAY